MQSVTMDAVELAGDATTKLSCVTVVIRPPVPGIETQRLTLSQIAYPMANANAAPVHRPARPAIRKPSHTMAARAVITIATDHRADACHAFASKWAVLPSELPTDLPNHGSVLDQTASKISPRADQSRPLQRAKGRSTSGS